MVSGNKIEYHGKNTRAQTNSANHDGRGNTHTNTDSNLRGCARDWHRESRTWKGETAIEMRVGAHPASLSSTHRSLYRLCRTIAHAQGCELHESEEIP
eukprot:3092969-Pyramimonas_sp.AAC.1